jgi:hypothetical protein
MNFVKSNKKFIQNNPLNEREGRSCDHTKEQISWLNSILQVKPNFAALGEQAVTSPWAMLAEGAGGTIAAFDAWTRHWTENGAI